MKIKAKLDNLYRNKDLFSLCDYGLINISLLLPFVEEVRTVLK